MDYTFKDKAHQLYMTYNTSLEVNKKSHESILESIKELENTYIVEINEEGYYINKIVKINKITLNLSTELESNIIECDMKTIEITKTQLEITEIFDSYLSLNWLQGKEVWTEEQVQELIIKNLDKI